MGAKRLVRLLSLLKLSNTRAAIGLFVLLTAITASAVYGPFATIYDVKQFAQNEHVRTGKLMLWEIPKDASVSADPLLLPHLTHRKEAYMFPNPFIMFMYGKEFWLLQNGTAEDQNKVDYVVMDLSRTSPSYSAELYANFVAEFLNNRNYGLVKLEDSYALFKKGGNYSEGVCRLDSYFKTSVAAAVRVNLDKTLGDKGRMLLKQC